MVVGQCEDSPFGCGARLYPLSIASPGAVYTNIFLYYVSDHKYIYLAIRSDLTADIFALFPAVDGVSSCTDCPDQFGDIWLATGVAITYDENCSPQVPLTDLTRIVQCGDAGSPTLSVSITA
jgi:hypothetical protein